MDVQLEVVGGTTKRQSLRLRSAETIIGRQHGCDLRIPSASVSRRHCRLSVQDGFLMVEDLDSANGTFVNGERVATTTAVKPGDKLEIGPVTFVVKYQLSSAAIDRLLQQGEIVTPVAVGEGEQDLVEVFGVGEAKDAILIDHEESTDPDQLAVTEEGSSEPKTVTAKSEQTVEFLEDMRLQLPEEQDLRDILSKLDDSK